MMWSIKLVQLFRGCCKSVIYIEIFKKGFWLSDSDLIIFEVNQFWKQIVPPKSMWKGEQKKHMKARVIKCFVIELLPFEIFEMWKF